MAKDNDIDILLTHSSMSGHSDSQSLSHYISISGTFGIIGKLNTSRSGFTTKLFVMNLPLRWLVMWMIEEVFIWLIWFRLWIFYLSFQSLYDFFIVFLFCFIEDVAPAFDFCRVLTIEFLRFINVRYAPFVSYNFPEFVVIQYGL